MAYLAVEADNGATDRRSYPLGRDVVVIGRAAECIVRLQDHTVSKAHAKLLRLDGRFLLRDLGSRNGTFVNGQRVAEATLKDGDKLRIGGTTFRLVTTTAKAASARVAARLAEEENASAAIVDPALVGAPGEVGLERLRRLHATLRETQDPLELLTRALHPLIDIVAAERGSLLVLEEGSAAPTLRVDGASVEDEVVIDLREAPIESAVETHAATTLEAGSGGARRHVLAVPLHAGRLIVGAAVFDRGPGHSAFTILERTLAEVAAFATGYALLSALLGADGPLPEPPPSPREDRSGPPTVSDPHETV